MKQIVNPLGLAKAAVEEYRSCYGQDLVSAIVYGSAAGGDFDPRKSDINLLLILSSLSLPLIARSVPVQNRWERKRFSRPLFMDKEYVSRSLDSFPIEFLNMKGCYLVLHGEDVFSGLRIDPRHLRLQLERELKGKQLHLTQEWIRVKDNPKLLSELIGISLRDFAASFRAFLHLRGQTIPRERKAIFAAVSEVCGLAGSPLEQALEASKTRDRGRLTVTFSRYVEAIKQITDIVDRDTEKEAV